MTVYFLNVAFYYFVPNFLYANVFLSSMCLIMLNIFHLVFCFLFSFQNNTSTRESEGDDLSRSDRVGDGGGGGGFRCTVL